MENFKNIIADFHYKKPPVWFFIIFFIPSFFYFVIINIKNFLYKIKILKEVKVNAKVICIGNLTTGGVGKTPVVIEIGNYLAKQGKNVAILSRGYGCKLDNSIPTIIKAKDEIIIDDVELTGDEVNLISKYTNNVSIVICKDRVKGANYAISKLDADTILMDDGFSNRKIYKDLNIILTDENKMFGNNFLLPLGPLREPLYEISRADRVLFINKTNDENEKLSDFKKKLKIKYTTCKMKTGKIYNIKTGAILNEKNIPVLAFSAIGQPEQFYKKLEDDFEIKKTISFDDHFKYNQYTVDKIIKTAQIAGAQVIITTEKDMVKLLNFGNIENIYALKLDIELSIENLL